MKVPPTSRRFRSLSTAAALALLGLPIRPSPGADEIWIGPSGNWSTPALWLDGTAPPIGGDAGATFVFTNPASGAVTSTDDLFGPFEDGHYPLQVQLN